MGKFTLAFLGFLISFVVATNVWSKDFGIAYQGAEIEEAVVVVSTVNGKPSARLQMTLTNTAIDKITIVGVRSSLHKGSKIFAQISPEKVTRIETVSVLSEEKLSMKEAGIFIQLDNLENPVPLSDKTEFRLILVNGEMPFKAHITTPTH